MYRSVMLFIVLLVLVGCASRVLARPVDEVNVERLKHFDEESGRSLWMVYPYDLQPYDLELPPQMKTDLSKLIKFGLKSDLVSKHNLVARGCVVLVNDQTSQEMHELMHSINPTAKLTGWIDETVDRYAGILCSVSSTGSLLIWREGVPEFVTSRTVEAAYYHSPLWDVDTSEGLTPEVLEMLGRPFGLMGESESQTVLPLHLGYTGMIFLNFRPQLWSNEVGFGIDWFNAIVMNPRQYLTWTPVDGIEVDIPRIQ